MAALLQHSPAEIIMMMMAELALAQPKLNGWQFFCTSEPGEPDQVITVYESGSRVVGRFQLDGSLTEHYGIQFKIRANKVADGRLVASILKGMMTTVSRVRVVVDSIVYRVECLSNIGPTLALGHDPKQYGRRFYFTINCTTSITPYDPSAAITVPPSVSPPQYPSNVEPSPPGGIYLGSDYF